MKYLGDAPSLAEDVCGKRPKNALDKEPAGKVLSICMDYVYRVTMGDVVECKFKKYITEQTKRGLRNLSL